MDMSALNLKNVKEKLDEIAKFLHPILPLANGHATDFITKGYWDRYIPKCLQDELLSLSKEQLNSLPCNTFTQERLSVRPSKDFNCQVPKSKFNKDTKIENCVYCHGNNKLPCDCGYRNNDVHSQCLNTYKACDNISNKVSNLTEYSSDSDGKLPFLKISEFSSAVKASSIEGLGLAVTPETLLAKFGIYRQNDLFIGTFMSEKKSHEVEIMSKVCSSIASGSKCKLVIDFGSGKGYLGKHLSLQFKIPVLGIDAVETNTQSAEQRNTVLDKQWQGLTRNAEYKLEGKKLSKREKKISKLRDKTNDRDKNKSKTDFVVDSAQSEVITISNELDRTKPYSKYHARIDDEVANDGVISIADNNSEQKPSQEMLVKFVPCTCFIDENTDFMELAKSNFPYLFPSEHVHEDTLGSLHVIKQLSCYKDKGCESKQKCSSNVGKCDICHHSYDSCRTVNTALMTPCSQKSADASVDEMSCLCRKISLQEENILKEKCLCIKCSSSEDSGAISSSTEECGTKFSFSGDYSTKDSDRINIMLVGLHTCGNLASTSIELFTKNDQLSVLCSVGCCYHLISEKYLENGTEEVKETSGFPLSSCLNKKKFSLGNTARNLASQAVYRVPEFEQLQGERFYPRALLEVILQDVMGNDMETPKGLRGLEKKSKSMKEYLRRACDKLRISNKVSDEMLDVYIKKYEYEKHHLAAFFQLKTLLAPCIESLIVLDRVAFLLEQDNVGDVYLVKMFDPVVSPRCYAIVAFKK